MVCNNLAIHEHGIYVYIIWVTFFLLSMFLLFYINLEAYFIRYTKTFTILMIYLFSLLIPSQFPLSFSSLLSSWDLVCNTYITGSQVKSLYILMQGWLITDTKEFKIGVMFGEVACLFLATET